MDKYDGAEMCSAVAMGTYVLLGRHFTRRVVCVEALGVSGEQLMKKHAMSASLGKACKAHRTAMAGWPPARPREIKMTAYWTGCAAPHNTLPIFFFPFSHIFLSFFFPVPTLQYLFDFFPRLSTGCDALGLRESVTAARFVPSRAVKLKPV